MVLLWPYSSQDFLRLITPLDMSNEASTWHYHVLALLKLFGFMALLSGEESIVLEKLNGFSGYRQQ